jgi:hypothetical protein
MTSQDAPVNAWREPVEFTVPEVRPAPRDWRT